MPIAPSDFERVAGELLARRKPSGSEVLDRTAAGRAYYAAFLAVREFVRAEFRDSAFDCRHEHLYVDLLKTQDPGLQDVGDRLRQLFALRTTSDYHPGHHVSTLTTQLQLSNAQAILAALPTLKGRLAGCSIRRR